MKCSRLAIAIAVTSVLTAGVATAQQPLQPTVQPSAYEFGNYYAQDEQPASPSDREMAPEAPSAMSYTAPSCGMAATACDSCSSCGCDSGCGNGCGRCRPALNCCEDDPWQLFGCFNESNCHGITIGGWIDAGYATNDQNSPSKYNGVVTFDDREDVLRANQVYTYMEKAIDTGGCGWDFGGRVDLLYGTDSRFTESRGLETTQDFDPKWNSSPFYGLAMPQLYAEVGYNDLSVKLGHFYTIIGYEGVMATSNFFYSHAYTMQYGEPFTHTGALANYKYSDTTNILFGFDRGWDNWEDDANNRLNGLGGFTWDGGEGLTLAWTGTIGQEPGFANTFGNRYLSSFVLSKEFNDRLTYVFQNDIGYQNEAVSATQDAEWYGINQYLFYKLNCCWTAGARFEWFRDDDGFRVAGIPGRNSAHPLDGSSFIGDFYEVTLGLNWSPNANLIVRPEVRFDWFDGVTTGPNTGPFGDGTSDDQTTFAIDAILKY